VALPYKTKPKKTAIPYHRDPIYHLANKLTNVQSSIISEAHSSGKIIWALVILKFSPGYPGLRRLARLVRLPEAQQIPYSVMSQFQSLPEASLELV